MTVPTEPQEEDGVVCPAHEDWFDRNQLAFATMAAYMLTGGAGVMIAAILVAGEAERLFGTVPSAVVGVAELVLLKLGWVRAAFKLLVVGVWISCVNGLFLTHGLTGTTIGPLILLLAVASWMSGPATALSLAAATPPVLYGIAYLEAGGWPIAIGANVTPYQRALVHSLAAMSSAALGYFGAASLRERLNQLLGSQKQLKAQLAELQLRDEAVRRFQERFEKLFRSSPSASAITTPEGSVLDCNVQFENLLGLERKDIIGRSTLDLGLWRGADDHRQALRSIASEGQLRAFETELTASARQPRTLLVYATPLELSMEDSILFHLVDITERKQAEEQLRIAAVAFESQEGMIVTDADCVILRVNQAFTAETGYSAAEAVGRTPRILKSGRHDVAFYRNMWETITRTGTWQGDIWDRRKNGEIYPKWLTITAVKSAEGKVTHYVGAQIDITARKIEEEAIRDLAFYDPLTRLPNRRLLLDRIGHALASSSRSERFGALLFIDLDHFKSLNDSLGHDKGDLLLRQVAQRLTTCIRQGDTAARLGGDEFVVMLEDLGQNDQEATVLADTVGRKIIAAIGQPYLLAETSYNTTPSIGVTLFRGHHTAIDELLKQADLAMYQSKKAGRNTLRFYAAQADPRSGDPGQA